MLGRNPAAADDSHPDRAPGSDVNPQRPKVGAPRKLRLSPEIFHGPPERLLLSHPGMPPED